MKKSDNIADDMNRALGALGRAVGLPPRKRRRRDYPAHHVGRLRERAAAILRKQFPGWDVQPWDIKPATGHWRTDVRADVYRWELFTQTVPSPDTGRRLPVVCGCWETLTYFVRVASKAGCHVTRHDEIYAGPDDEK